MFTIYMKAQKHASFCVFAPFIASFTPPPHYTIYIIMVKGLYMYTAMLIKRGSVALSPAFLYEGTAEIALQDLTDLSEYTERRRKWESGVRFSVEQVWNRDSSPACCVMERYCTGLGTRLRVIV